MANKNGKEIKFSGYPQEKQMEFFRADTKYIAYGGARGGGKSWALRRKMVLLCLTYPGINILLIRRTLPELRDNHVRPLQCELKDICTYRELQKCFMFPGGSRLNLGYLDSDGDLLRYQGQEYDIIAIDEATQISEYQFGVLKASLRGANDFPKRMYLTCNPGGVGHSWVKRLFIDRNYRDGERAEDYTFIPARVYDNKILLDKNPDYLDQLKSLSPSLKNAWLNGEWEEFEGQFFPEFDYDRHSCDVFDLPPNAKKYCAIDYGLDMLACVFVAVTEDGKCVVYDEIHKENMIVSEAAKLIKQKNDGVCMYIAPSDLWSRQKDSGKSIAELFCENGVYLTRLKSERISGWMNLRELLKKEDKLIIFRNCVNLLRCLPLLMHDKSRVGDAATKPHAITHAPDALRYFAVSRYSDVFAVTQKGKKNKLKETIDKRQRRLL